MPDLALDVPLAAALLWVAWRSLTTPDLFKAVVLFITYGLLMALAWVRLGAPDIALAEAAIGAGLTGALLLDAVRQMDRAIEERPRAAIAVVAALLAAAITVALAAAVLALPAPPPGLGDTVRAALPAAGVEQPVTAVLLNFRGYDTWLELGVLLLAVVALLALRRAPDLRDLPLRVPDPLLASLTSVLAPLMVVAGVGVFLVVDLVLGVGQHQARIDELITAHAIDWTLDRMPAVDRNILRVAVYELDKGEVPLEVAIDEAVTLAKRYATDEAGRLVNGILGRIARGSEVA
jgi:uncharacterized MnhB-related membrane protein